MINKELKKEDYEHNAGVDDELTEDIVSEQIKSITLERDMFVKNRAKVVEGRDRFSSQWDRDKSMYELMLTGDNHKKIEGKLQYNYELVPKYWEIRKKQLEDKFTMDKHMSEAKIEQYNHQLEDIDKQIESDEAKLKELGE